ncbi:MAG TPA: protein-methionine-sulfoxide reductase heme-binding subunit MsrQ [Candidatus Binatia bacterium]
MKTRWIRVALFVIGLVPFAQLIYNALTNNLGANPIDAITRHTGSWALILLLVTLSVTPLRKIFSWNGLVKYRRMLGLFAFFYAALHFTTFLVLDHFFDFNAILKDIMKRPYVTAGFTGFVLMIPLVITSTAGMIRRLGKRWQQLHRLIYITAAAGVIHFYWLVKADIRRPVQYGFVLILLLGYRVAVALTPAAARYRTRTFSQLEARSTHSASTKSHSSPPMSGS